MLLRQRNIFLRITFYCGTFVLRMEIIVTYFSLRHNYIISLFDVVTFFDDVRDTLYFGTSELRMKTMLQLCFAFARHCEVSLLRHNYVIYLFDAVAFFDDVRITFYFGTFELCTYIR